MSAHDSVPVVAITHALIAIPFKRVTVADYDYRCHVRPLSISIHGIKSNTCHLVRVSHSRVTLR